MTQEMIKNRIDDFMEKRFWEDFIQVNQWITVWICERDVPKDASQYVEHHSKEGQHDDDHPAPAKSLVFKFWVDCWNVDLVHEGENDDTNRVADTIRWVLYSFIAILPANR